MYADLGPEAEPYLPMVWQAVRGRATPAETAGQRTGQTSGYPPRVLGATPTQDADALRETLAVVGKHYYSEGVTDYRDWAEAIKASVGPEVMPYLASVWETIVGLKDGQARLFGKAQNLLPKPSPAVDALVGAKTRQLTLFPVEPIDDMVQAIVLCQLKARRQPSAWELLSTVESRLGWKARWSLRPALQKLAEHPSLTSAVREYLKDLLQSRDLDTALKGAGAPKRKILTGIDSLLRQSEAYRTSRTFQEMVSFMAIFVTTRRITTCWSVSRTPHAAFTPLRLIG